MNINRLTLFVILIATLLLAGYDLFIFMTLGNDATISIVMKQLCEQYPVIPFVAGFICGHIFWPNYSLNETENDEEKDSYN